MDIDPSLDEYNLPPCIADVMAEQETIPQPSRRLFMAGMAATGAALAAASRWTPVARGAAAATAPASHALDGYNCSHAVLGASEKCIATHPSDMCVAQVVLDAVTRTQLADGSTHAIPFAEFYVSYGEDPAKENVLHHGEIITAVELPASPRAKTSTYLKVRDRSSYEFALASAAVTIELDGQVIKSVRVGLGGIATMPWRSHEAEAVLAGKHGSDGLFVKAAAAALAGAKGRGFNTFKIELAQRTLVRALQTATA